MKVLESVSVLLKRHAWLAVFSVTLALSLFPVGYWASRICLVFSSVGLWIWGAFLLRRRRLLSLAVFTTGLTVIGWFCLPGPSGDPAVLRQAYVTCLKEYEGTRYVWGGENRFGIDCSGLVRKGFILANIRTGVLTLNPCLVRAGLDLWWHDCTATALRDGYRSYTVRIAQVQTINEISADSTLPGDLAITTDGSHVLAYLGNKTWIEADPNEMKVLIIETPSDRAWFRTPVHLVRWHHLLDDSRLFNRDCILMFNK